MHPRNAPFAVAIAAVLGGVIIFTFIHNIPDYTNFGLVLMAACCGYILSFVINKSDVVTANQFRIILDGIRSELHAHREDHDIRAYDPKSVGAQLAALTAATTKLDNLLRSRISKSKNG